ncbi:uncharacterized protein FIBRA_07567 [Fibroporia radiculosa]|uniref:Snurportin-1 n=1 Tax=Fibroporia radiculosa TaxID=599839 RepID=J4GEX2_9APHY|nr:uncharacterized protein FIBRA_07567 [Fibroporia radiculosa]CCM05353.1 predicted protein [Fibroporia radiculosa]
MSTNDRKLSYKVPPATLRDTVTSQEHRRNRALEEQKRRRAERFDSTRQLDFFADLTLGPSDDEADDEDPMQGGPDIIQEGMVQFAAMLPPAGAGNSAKIVPSAATPRESAPPVSQESNVQTTGKKRGKRRKGKARQGAADGQQHQTSNRKKPSRWADKCMYAELLEMIEDQNAVQTCRDGIPDDIETGWVAVAPVPVGKRCLAVTHYTSGIAGVVPNTTLRSRVLGKQLMKPFPSPLPPQTILDCILDENWRDNGILHVLDVLKWKGQDVGECETPFRFWWRDTRLSELASFPPPPSAPEAGPEDSTVESSHASGSIPRYQFPYPHTLLPVPYHTNTTLAYFSNTLIPLTRSLRRVSVTLPLVPSQATPSMDLHGAAPPVVELYSVFREIRSDGLLLYVAQATYEPGTSPLSSWVPLQAYADDAHKPGREQVSSAQGGPLDVFERSVLR